MTSKGVSCSLSNTLFDPKNRRSSRLTDFPLKPSRPKEGRVRFLRCSTVGQFQIPRRVFSPTGPPAEISRVSGGRSTPRAPTTSSSSCDDDDDHFLSIFSIPIRSMKCTQSVGSKYAQVTLRRSKVFTLPTSLLRRLRSDDSLELRTSQLCTVIAAIDRIAKKKLALCMTCSCLVWVYVFGPPASFTGSQ